MNQSVPTSEKDFFGIKKGVKERKMCCFDLFFYSIYILVIVFVSH